MSNSPYPELLDELINILTSLPSVGRRSAERMALALLSWDNNKLQTFSKIISDIPEKITPCPNCGNFSQLGSLCTVCSCADRDSTLICVVEQPTQIKSIESSSLFKGVYHVLGGKLSPLSGVGVEDLNLSSLIKKISENKVNELILALSADVEGQATSVYIANAAKEFGVKVTQLAQGLPAGSDLSYVDPATIAVAISGRRDF